MKYQQHIFYQHKTI